MYIPRRLNHPHLKRTGRIPDGSRAKVHRRHSAIGEPISWASERFISCFFSSQRWLYQLDSVRAISCLQAPSLRFISPEKLQKFLSPTPTRSQSFVNTRSGAKRIERLRAQMPSTWKFSFSWVLVRTLFSFYWPVKNGSVVWSIQSSNIFRSGN